jgi:hypothetical protein
MPGEIQPNNGLLEPQQPGSPVVRTVDFQRVSRRAAPAYHSEAATLDAAHSRHASADDQPHAAHPAINTTHLNGDSRSYEGSIASRDGGGALPSVVTTTSYPRSTASPPQTGPPNHPPPPVPEAISNASSSNRGRTPSPMARPYRESQPLPMLPPGSHPGAGRSQTPPPPLPVQQGNKILFYGM